MRENLKVLDTKLNKEICPMALVKNQGYSKNSKNILAIRRFNIPKLKFIKIKFRELILRDYVTIGFV